MKLFAIYFMLLTAFTAKSGTAISISEALRQKLITIRILSLDRSHDSIFYPAFYNQCLVFEIKNLKSTSLELREDEGRFLMPDDSTLQRMVITSAITLALSSYQKKSVPVFAMCSEAHDGAPGISTVFSYGKIAEGNLLALVKMLAKKNYQNDAAQDAVWCITDNYSPYTISSKDTALRNELCKFVCELKNIPYEPGKEEVIIQRPHSAHVAGDFHYTIASTHTIDLRIYNQEGQLVKDLVHCEKQHEGTYTYRYEADIPVNDDRHPPAIIVRFYFDGKLVSEKTHLLRNY